MATLDSFTDWLDEWDLVLRGSDVVAGTRTVYLRSCRQFLAWLADTNPRPAEMGELTELHAFGWAGHLKNERGLAAATRRVRVIAVRFWLDYVAGQPESGLAVNPFAKVPLPVPDEPEVPVIPDEDLSALLRTCEGSTDFVDIRDAAILRLMLDAGPRRAEVSGINVDDLDLREQDVAVLGKGGKRRRLPFGTKTALALRKYLRARARRPYADSAALFLSARPHPSGDCRLTGQGIEEMVRRREKQAGIGHIWPHMFRHTWAHDMLDNGASEGDVERLGGWSRGSKMVRRYGSSMADARARKAARRLSRGDRV